MICLNVDASLTDPLHHASFLAAVTVTMQRDAGFANYVLRFKRDNDGGCGLVHATPLPVLNSSRHTCL